MILAIAVSLITLAGAFLGFRDDHRCPRCGRWGLRRISPNVVWCPACAKKVNRPVRELPF